MTSADNHRPGLLRLGAVNYLNSKPLVHGLKERLPQDSVRFDLPSRLADSLAAGRLDIALIPCVEVLRNPDYRIISDACVAANGPVLSVKVYFRKPPKQVRTLALDEGSRTSAALAQVLLANRFDLRPELVDLPIGCGSESVDADAVLLIGDRAMLPARESFVDEWDLSGEWRAETGLPFVFACWAARRDLPADAIAEANIASILNQTRDAGVAAIDEIAVRESRLLGIDSDYAINYLQNNLHYHLGPDELQGLRLYAQHCERLGLLAGADAPR